MIQVFDSKASSHPRDLKDSRDSGDSINFRDCREEEISHIVQVLEF